MIRPEFAAPSPKPEVLYLPAIFREIRSGKIRVPAFQRGFVWKQGQIIELLESVYQGFPIGSLLFWTTDVGSMKTDTSSAIPFPHPDVTGNVDFVLDGMQRIASLYGALSAPDRSGEADLFALLFDLRRETFVTAREPPGPNDARISLRHLFSPKLLLEDQARLGSLRDGEELVDRTIELQRTFQEYLLPVIRLGDTSPSQVVQIFERVNNTGTKLSAIDFMRAQTWSNDFDLSEQVQLLSQDLADLRFDLPQDAIAKTIALSLNVAPTGEQMVHLRKRSSDELLAAIEITRTALRAAIEYFQESLALQNYAFIPYEGQFLVAASVAITHGPALPSWFPEWFWTVGFSETLQGRPDHAIAKLAIDARSSVPAGLPEQLSLAADDIMSRGIRKGGALGMTAVSAIATAPAHSVLSGAPLPARTLTAGFDTSMLGAVFSRAELGVVTARLPRTEKIVFNVVLLGPTERSVSPNDLRAAIVELAQRPGGISKLASQCLDAACVTALRKGNVRGFVDARTKAILRRAHELCGKVRAAEAVSSIRDLTEATQSEIDTLVEQALQEYSYHLVDANDVITSLMAETNASGYYADEIEVLSAGPLNVEDASIPFHARIHFVGEAHEDRMYSGHEIAAELEGTVAFDGSAWEMRECNIISAEIEHD